MSSNPIPTRGQALPALTGIRLVAATWVVLFHFQDVVYHLLPVSLRGREIIDSGYLGVEVFFVLSGFILSHTWSERLRSGDAGVLRRFYSGRFARMYPLHLVSLVGVGLLALGAHVLGRSLSSEAVYTPVSFIENLALLQMISPEDSWNPPAWSLSAEAAAYLVLPVLVIVIARLRSGLALAVATVGAVGIATVATIAVTRGASFEPTSIGAVWVRIATEFLAGCLLWSCWQRFEVLRTSSTVLALVGGVGVLAVVVGIDGVGPSDFLVVPFVAALVVGCAQVSGPVASALGTRVWDYGGRISFGLYIAHLPVLMVMSNVLPWESHEHDSIVVRTAIVVAYLGTALLAAMILYRVVEEPARRRIIREMDRRWS